MFYSKKMVLATLGLVLLLSSSLMAKTYKLFVYGEKGTPGNALLLDKIAVFEKKHKGTKIKVEMTSGKSYHDKLKLLALGNKLPDIMHIWNGSKTSYVTSKGLLTDLRPFITKSVRNKYIKSALVGQDKKGAIYQIPEALTLTGVVFSNKKLLKKLGLKYPKTYKQWLKQVKTIQDEGLTPLAVGNKGDWVMQSIVLSALLGRTAGDKWLLKAVNGKAKFSDKQFVSALAILEEMYKKRLLDEATPNWDYNQGSNEFLTSKAVYTMNGGWIINSYMKDGTALFVDNIGVHSFPSINGEKNKGSVSGILGTGLGINNKLSKADKKILFDLVLIYSGLGMEKEAIKAGTVPLTKKAKLDNYTNSIVKKLKKLSDNSKITYVFDGIMDSKSVGKLQGLINEMFLGSKTSKEVAVEFEAYAKKYSPHRK
jgi:raffinose/stachyose/melibiose transport system substrate-binding protein